MKMNYRMRLPSNANIVLLLEVEGGSPHEAPFSSTPIRLKPDGQRPRGE
eukprot:CAMPEP_0118996384 /NCGR_PEP_ID=MMETSP1173-20130426/59989_1 /TAXON_ID=1034831 /ORGANISM="Rhizochromulina marina cf, Strain CCMP1243" /LENGTH=48 /DNA_ID= /DNA_START= /DNA_END= /DNA_ORIENTATION=